MKKIFRCSDKFKKSTDDNLLNAGDTTHKKRRDLNKENSTEEIKRLNRLYFIWMMSFCIYCILESILRGEIYNQSNKFIRYSPVYVSILVASFMIKKSISEYTILKKTLLNNIFFIILMIVFSIISTLYISKPIMESFFDINYLYKPYWLLYIINNIVTIVLGSILILNKNYNFIYKIDEINENIFKYPFFITIITILIIKFIKF